MIHYCFLDDFNSNISYSIKELTVKWELEKLHNPAEVNIDKLFVQAHNASWMQLSEDEKQKFYKKYINQAHIEIEGIRWSDRVQSQSGTWSGNVFDFFVKVALKLTADLKVPFKTDGIYRIEDTPVHEAVREAVANCLCNTDFYSPDMVIIEK